MRNLSIAIYEYLDMNHCPFDIILGLDKEKNPISICEFYYIGNRNHCLIDTFIVENEEYADLMLNEVNEIVDIEKDRINAPTMLADIPQVRTYINAYDSKSHTLDALVDKLLTGADAFTGQDPIDSFCGMWDTKI